MSTEPIAKLKIEADLAECINYASWQNSVPLIRSLAIHNPSAEILENIRLEVSSSPAFIKPKSWQVDRVLPGDQIVIRDRHVEFDPDYLLGLNEAERGLITIVAMNQNGVLAESTFDLRLLARNEWGGLRSSGELIAAFVMPNDPALAKILNSAADILSNNGHPSGLDGYQSGDARRAYLLVAAIWSSITSMSITYASPPKSFEKVGQKTREPRAIDEHRLATCLDTSLLFASAIEAVGLNPIIVFTQGHCFTGFWLTEKTQDKIIENDSSEIRKAIAAEELITFESTLVTHRPPGKFAQAIQLAQNATRESEEGNFVASIGIARARMAQIRPLASHSKETNGKTEPASPSDSTTMPLGPIPEFRALGPQESVEKPTTPSGRIDRWQRKLLDLSLRNNLLNFRTRKSTIPLLCPNIALLEDRLAGGKRMKLISLPDHNPLGERDPEIHQQKTHENLNQVFAEQALERNEVCCKLPTEDLNKQLTALYRSVRNDMAEGGTNTLFLAVGFLRWRQRPNDSRSFRAPLLLVPVKLIRKSASSPFRLTLHEDETRFNATLIQLLKKDFDKDISRFETDLPADENGVDVPRVLEQVRHEVRDIQGFEVVNDTALSRFSFAKYLMWKDMVDRIDQLKNNRVVKHLIENPDQVFASPAGAIPLAAEMDNRYDPAEIYHPLPADSSQLAAVMAASEGHDFILIGPPGTGKSQTIANIISQCLGIGKSVLFVAEKTAALDVVHRRLQQNGLGECCVELHSNKAERKTFLEQLGNSWNSNRNAQKSDWVSVNNRLKIRRDELNAYVSAVHEVSPCGWSAFDAFGVSSKGADLPASKFDWDAAIRHDKQAYENLETIAREVAVSFEAVGVEKTLPMISKNEWSVAWENRLLESCQRLQESTDSLETAISNLTARLDIPQFVDGSNADLENLKQLSVRIVESAGEDVRILFHKKFAEFPGALKDLENAITLHDQATASLSAAYTNHLDTLPLEELDVQWRQAISSFWPMSWFGKRKLKRLMQTYADSGSSNPAIDLNAIRIIRQQQASVKSNPLADQTKKWHGLETDLESLKQQITKASNLRQAILGFGKPTGLTHQITKAIQPHISGKPADDVLFQLAAELVEAHQIQASEISKFELESGQALDNATPMACQSTKQLCQFVTENRTQLQRWTAWCNSKSDAQMAGLTPLVSDLEQGQFPASQTLERFRLGYSRWLIPHLVDNHPVLKSFQKHKHEHAVEDFRQLDDQARSLASSQAKKGMEHGLPAVEKVTRNSELGLLRHQMQLKRPSKSIRHVITNMPESFGKLAPCLLMSPLSIAQYLPTHQQLFDVVVFDEASQITTWDAIGAIARGRQTIIVGDPKQLPPTNFFGRTDDDEEDEELEDHEKDLESILDEAKASGLPTLELNWHYRSRHESLIAFSNYHYYHNNLITFPAADSTGSGVTFTHLPDTVYDRGKSRTNRKEAEAIVAEAVRRMQDNLAVEESERLTFGVITFNSQQQSLIQDLFDEAQRQNPDLDWYFSDSRIEPTVVKNLENVQGDERDVMFFSITFGTIENRTEVPLTFGALNRDGGERRLNVAITRTRRELHVFSNFKADQLPAERSQSRGVRDLKKFLEYAEKGPDVLGNTPEGSVGGFDSPFEEAVADAIEAKGWQIVSQIGVSGFRIDLGVVHPHKPGAFLAGIECDGATYHRSAVARDRDKTRQLVLENLGWNIFRVWSPDWWYNAEGATEELHKHLTALLEAESKLKAAVPSNVEKTNSEGEATDQDSAKPDAVNLDEDDSNPNSPEDG